jgi:hypothetical protein
MSPSSALLAEGLVRRFSKSPHTAFGASPSLRTSLDPPFLPPGFPLFTTGDVEAGDQQPRKWEWTGPYWKEDNIWQFLVHKEIYEGIIRNMAQRLSIFNRMPTYKG